MEESLSIHCFSLCVCVRETEYSATESRPIVLREHPPISPIRKQSTQRTLHQRDGMAVRLVVVLVS